MLTALPFAFHAEFLPTLAIETVFKKNRISKDMTDVIKEMEDEDSNDDDDDGLKGQIDNYF